MSSGTTTYLARHAQALLGTIGRLTRQPLASLFTMLVIALALALPASLWVFVANARAAVGGFANTVELTVYLQPEVPLDKAQQLARSARERSGVQAVTLVSAAEGLAEFREYSGFGAALEALEGNPLPHVLKIRPATQGTGVAEIAALQSYLEAWPEVDSVRSDTAWVERLRAILDLVARLTSVASVVLGIGVLAVIGNTIRLEINARRAEIEVTKLVGGSNAFVRRPFLYAGLLYGLGGALTAWLIVSVAVAVLAGPATALASTYGRRFELLGLDARAILAVLISGMLLGLVGAWISSARHLASIEPRS